MITAIILAGGLGTRLAPVLPHLPKALAPIAGVPFLSLLLRKLEESRLIAKVILALGHKASSIQSFLSDHAYSFPIAYSLESTPLGTGGALLHALVQAHTSTLLVLNGDSYCDLSITDFFRSHQTRSAEISIACQYVEDTSRYGSISWNSSYKIEQFAEKAPNICPGWINAGLYFLQKEILPPWPPGPYSLEKDFFPLFLKKKIFAYPHRGAFIDIGTPSSYNQAQELLKPWILQ